MDEVVFFFYFSLSLGEFRYKFIVIGEGFLNWDFIFKMYIMDLMYII